MSWPKRCMIAVIGGLCFVLVVALARTTGSSEACDPVTDRPPPNANDAGVGDPRNHGGDPGGMPAQRGRRLGSMVGAAGRRSG